MKILLSVEHPAWAHQFRYVYKELTEKGHEVKVVAIKKDVDLELLDAFNIPYEVISETSGINTFEKGMIFLKTTFKIFKTSNKFRPDMYIGRASPMMAINSFLFRKPHIIFEDSEPSKFCLFVCKLFSDVIITPTCFKSDLGKKQVRVNAYKELFYLHPKYFKPNAQILQDIGINEKKFALIRFVSWNAHHDIGQHGINDSEKTQLVFELEKYCKVYISSEGEIPQELKDKKLLIPPEKIHDVLNYASLFVSDSQTMSTEAALIGTPAIRYNTFVGDNDMGNFSELEKKYQLLYNYNSFSKALAQSIKLIQDDTLKLKFISKRDKMLDEMIEINDYFLKTILSYNR